MRALLLAFFLGSPSFGELTLPTQTSDAPAAGKRVRITPLDYAGTEVHHSLYLPSTWKPDTSGHLLIVEYPGNKFEKSGSTGKVSDTALGFGLTAGKAIWVTLPFIAPDGRKNALTWWGDEKATIAYALKNIPRICQTYGADPKKVILCGFSRGAIATFYIGLHNDEIASLWAGFATHDHFDGERQWSAPWGSPLAKYRKEATTRLARLKNRPVLVCQNNSTASIKTYLTGRTPLDKFTFLDVNIARLFPTFPNELAKAPHTDRWLLKPGPERDLAWKWVKQFSESR